MDTRAKRIFITGIAGFIGFHLALYLKRRGDVVIGVDNFNDYYTPMLKRARAARLHNEGISVFETDIRNKAGLISLLQKHQITHVVHLAAQAGVRHSIVQPDDYVDSNLHGFVSILETCRHHPGVSLVFASSSSVYGLNGKTPFSVDDATDHPANLYGATKKAGEAMAHAYHHLYGIPTRGLRYFTAYGPWGRPDMAYFRFADLIWEGKPIQVFNGGNMRRDFTYIDDIVRGTAAAIDFESAWDIFNLGHHRPVALKTLIALLEERLD
ncbi:MAG: hypothetical protein RL235_938, partial [Chlamydiota bacterium]